jgi:hypothetical protein
MTRNQTTLSMALGLAWTIAACGGGQPRHSASDTLTERQRDSILAGSSIPGARGVGAALRAADTTSARVRAADSVAP